MKWLRVAAGFTLCSFFLVATPSNASAAGSPLVSMHSFVSAEGELPQIKDIAILTRSYLTTSGTYGTPVDYIKDA